MTTTEVLPVNLNNVPAAPKQKITTQVLGQIEALRGKGALQLPADYSPGNALNSAWLALQEVVDRTGKPIFVNGQLSNVVTQVSVANALLDMVVQGLNPAKKQGYFIVYGEKLIWQRSYFGDEALATRVKPGIEVYRAVVRKGDDFEYETIRGRTVVTRHRQTLENRDGEILAAYCGIYDQSTGEDLGCELMTMDRIRKSWGMSKTYSATNANATHNKFPDEMSLRTVVRRRLKPIINASSDSTLLDAVKRQDMDGAEAEIAEEIAENANREPLALSTPIVPASPVAPSSEPVAVNQDPAPPEGEEF